MLGIVKGELKLKMSKSPVQYPLFNLHDDKDGIQPLRDEIRIFCQAHNIPTLHILHDM